MKQRPITLYRNLALLSVLTIFASLRGLAQLSAGSLNQTNFQVPTGESYTINITSATGGSGCSGTGSYSWVMGTTEANAVSIGGNTASFTYTHTWTAFTSIWRVYTCSTGGSIYTNAIAIVPQSPFTPGVVGPATQAISSGGTPTTLSATVSTGSVFGPTYTYQWQSSADGSTWMNVGSSSTTDPSYSPGPLAATTYYRQAVTAGPLTLWTNAVTVTVNTALSAGSISPASGSVIYGGTGPALSLTGVTGGTGTYTYQWESSPDNASWQAIPNALSATYTPTDVTSKTYYMVYVTSGTTLPSASAMVYLQGDVSSVPAADNPTGNPNTNMNWVISKVNDGSGNMLSESKVFFDNSGRQMQLQNKVFYRANSATTYTHVLASQVVRDVYGREVLNTMNAPIDYADFNYMPGFIQATDGTSYTYKNFDLFDPAGTQNDLTNSPQPIGGQSTKGTLGWYYSANNTWEPYTATSNYPYSRKSIYQDGTNNAKKQAATGEVFVMGSTHETSDYTTPVSGELANYMLVRTRFFPVTQVGASPTTLENNALQTVSRDANQNEAVSIVDKSGKVVMTAKPGTDLIVNNTIGLIAPSAINYSQEVISSSGTGFSIQTLTGGNNLNIYLVGNTGAIITVYTGAAGGYNLNSAISGTGTLVIQSDVGFSVVYTNSGVQYTVNSSAGPGAPALGYFKILANNTPVSITGSYTLYDMNTEVVTSLNSGDLNKGYYKVVANSGIVNVTYSNGYTDIAYYFYNQLGQKVANIPPNGVKLLEGTGYTNYSTPASIPYVCLYTYDTRGRLFSVTTPDNGLTQMYYRLDGKIRFSQNANQLSAGSFSFCNYDQNGRLIQFGVYTPGTGGVGFGGSAMTAILETTGLWGGLTNGTMTDVSQSNYDLTDNTYNGAANVSAYTQDANYLGGAVSTSMRYSTIVNNLPSTTNLVSQSWYNYDEEGKMVWQIKYIPGLGSNGYKSTDYTYDELGRLIKTIFQATVPAETFVHYFQYDPANGSLYQTYTATSDVGVSNATLQATYVYYLQGGLKRVQLGGNIQGIDYTYTLQGNLKAINNSNNLSTADDPGGDAVATNGFNPDVFGEVLDYYPHDYDNARASSIVSIDGVNTNSIVGSENYNGTIKAMSWYSTKPSGMGGSNAPTTYVYNFDQNYNLVASTWGTGLTFGTVPAGFTATTVNRESIVVPGSGTPGTTSPGTSAYDGNGNILNLQRSNAAGTQTDVFAYNYKSGTNQLASLTNTGTTGDSYTYSYDLNGREISETTSNSAYNKYFRYDASGKVTMVARDGGFTQPVVGFVYDENGKRIEKLSYNSSYQLSQVTYYYQGVVYTQTVTNGTYGSLTPLEYAVRGPNGRIGIYAKLGNTYLYELKDHLGNVRAVVGAIGAVQTATDYYPYGMIIATIGSSSRYQYQGQYSENDVETGWNSFELRMYNPRTGKWVIPDPANAYFSPYEGMGNNPINNFDPTGAEPPTDCDDCQVGYHYTDGTGSWTYMGGFWQYDKGQGDDNWTVMVGPVMAAAIVTQTSSLAGLNEDIKETLAPAPNGTWLNSTNTVVLKPGQLKLPAHFGTLEASITESIRNAEPGKIGSINYNWEVKNYQLVLASVDLNVTIFSASVNSEGGFQAGLSVFGVSGKIGTGSMYPFSFEGSLDFDMGNNESIGIDTKFTPNRQFYSAALTVAAAISSEGLISPASGGGSPSFQPSYAH